MRSIAQKLFGVLLLPLLLVGFVSCQFEDDALLGLGRNGRTGQGGSFPTDYNDYSFENNDDEEPVVESRGLFTDDKQSKLKPTFVSPVERFMRTLLKPLSWVLHVGGGEGDGGKNNTTNKPNLLIKPTKAAGRTIRGSFGQVLDSIGSKFKAIYPGTEWCGAGNVSSSVDDVGLFKKTDSCCREHDLCNLNMEAGESRNGLLNSGTFTRSHCACDTKFYQCLKKVRSLVSSNIGYTYFNVLRPQCFREDYPATCAKYGRKRLRYNKCLEYTYNTTMRKEWQWFDNPDY